MKIFKKFLWLMLFVYLIIIFFPKTNAYYLAEKQLLHKNIVLSGESTSDLGLLFNISDIDVYYESLKVGKVKNINTFITLFYNHISLNNAAFSSSLGAFNLKSIDNISAVWTLFYPIKIFLSGQTEFATLSGSINLIKKHVSLDIKIKQGNFSQYVEMLKDAGLKQVKNGEFKYEANL